MLGSNDYLGLSTDDRVLEETAQTLRLYGTGTCLYPLFATTPLHEALCQGLAAFLGTEAAMLFSSGSAANSGVLATLVGEGDVIVSDQLNHASIIDGCRLSRAKVIAYRNRDSVDLRAKLEQTGSAKHKLVVTDGIFSMEGGAAPLREIYALAREFDAILMIDESHATGVVGPDGKGTGPLLGLSNDMPGIVLTGSLSKAIGGASGGYVAGAGETIKRLQANSRSWIFTMGMTTANAATALAALNICRTDPKPLSRLRKNMSFLRAALADRGIKYLESDSPITAVPMGNEEVAAQVSARLFYKDVYIPAIRYPVVARGEARLRIQVSANHSSENLAWAAEAILECTVAANR
jgi:glycine C-acetyltransferase